MSLKKKSGRPSFTLARMLLVMAALMLWALPAAAEAENAMAEPSNAADTPCKDLKPFNNLDELLYQFYINLDSDCLFTMPVAELEKIWDTKILTEERYETGQFNALDFSRKPYQSERDAFYIEIERVVTTGKNIFHLRITEEYLEKHATLFPDETCPKLLPESLISVNHDMLHPSSPLYSPPLPPKIVSKYNLRSNHYFWLNSQKTSMIILGGLYGVTSIKVINHVPPSFKEAERSN